MVVFIDVDTVNDFFKGGKLEVPNTDSIRDNLRELTHKALIENIPVLAFNDAHPEDASEFKTFPPHCLIGTDGAEKIEETTLVKNKTVIIPQSTIPNVNLQINQPDTQMFIFQKNTYDIFDPNLGNTSIDQFLKDENGVGDRITDVVVYGVVTEICVHAAVRGLVSRRIRVHVVEDAIMHLDERKAEECFEAWDVWGVNLVTTKIVTL